MSEANPAARGWGWVVRADALRERSALAYSVACALLGVVVLAGQELVMGHRLADVYRHPPQSIDHDIAVALAERGAYEIAPGRPTFFRPPGNSVLLAGWMRAFGEGDVAIYGLYGAYLLLFGAACALLADLAARTSRRGLAGPLAVALFATSPVVARYAGTFMGDVTAAALHVGWIYCLARAWSAPARLRWLGGAALTLLVASTFRPVTLAFTPLIGVLALAWRSERKYLLAATLATALGVGLFALPWMARNRQVCGTFSAYSQTGIMAWGGANWETRGLVHGPPAAEFLARYREASTGPTPGCFEPELNRVYTERASALLRSQAYWKTGVVWSLNALRTWFGLDVASTTGRWVRWYPLLAAHQLLMMVLGALAFRRKELRWEPPWVILLGFCLYLTAAHSVVSTEPRYSLPAVPILCLFASVRLAHAWAAREAGGKASSTSPAPAA